jgi:hypothetical protein
MPKASGQSAAILGLKLAMRTAAFCLMLAPVNLNARSAPNGEVSPPHSLDLQSMQAEPLADNMRAYRLIWHAWHKKPGILTLWCDPAACSAELRHTDGFGTYRRGNLAGLYTLRVERTKALEVMAAIDAGGLWTLDPQVRDKNGARPGLPQDSIDSICLHAPHYFIEAKDSGRSLLAYRYCQSNYMDGLNAVAPLIALFDELFPIPLAMIKPTPPKKQKIPRQET